MPKTAISTPQAPAAIGPYSQAIRVGDTLYTSGQIPIDPSTGNFVPGGITEQTVQVCENLKAILAQAGLDMIHVVKTTVFLKDMKDFAAMNEVYARYLAPEGAIAPARSTVQVAALPKDALVEIEVIAKEAPSAYGLTRIYTDQKAFKPVSIGEDRVRSFWRGAHRMDEDCICLKRFRRPRKNGRRSSLPSSTT